jgi:hypothetical protein
MQYGLHIEGSASQLQPDRAQMYACETEASRCSKVAVVSRSIIKSEREKFALDPTPRVRTTAFRHHSGLVPQGSPEEAV